MQMLQIKKRDGHLDAFQPSKILNRIKKAAKGLRVNSDQIFINVITSMPTQGIITTTELDTLIANTAAPYTGTHYDYSYFAAHIAISSIHKEINLDFYEVMSGLSNSGIVNTKLIEIIESYGRENVQAILDYSRNDMFNFFAWKTLETMYLLKDHNGKVVESPQMMYLRVALWITNTIDEAKELYNNLSLQLISCATPIMINSGTKNSQLASCVLHYNEDDSREGLLNTINDISTYSSAGAGIGISMSNIRSKESRIKSSGGMAGGLLKYLKIINESLRFFNQQGRRPGSAAIYLEPWHKDIMDLLDIKKNTGSEEMRARDLFTALMIPDNFMRAIKENSDWYLFCPNDIKKAGLKAFETIYGDEYEMEYKKAVELGLGKKVDVKEILIKLIESQIETGVPYILFKDHINRKSNHQNYGTINQSNLCLPGDSIILVKIEGEEIELSMEAITIAFNQGIKIAAKSYNIKTEEDEYKLVTNAGITGGYQELLEIEDETGLNFQCTPEHEVYTINRGYVMAKDLVETDELKIDWDRLEQTAVTLESRIKA